MLTKKRTSYAINGWVVEITKKDVSIHTPTKDVIIRFLHGTNQAAFISYLVSEKANQELLGLFAAFRLSTTLFCNVDMTKSIFEAAERIFGHKKPEKVSKKKDDVILAEERLKTEKTEDALDDLTKQSNGKKKTNPRSKRAH